MKRSLLVLLALAATTRAGAAPAWAPETRPADRATPSAIPGGNTSKLRGLTPSVPANAGAQAGTVSASKHNLSATGPGRIRIADGDHAHAIAEIPPPHHVIPADHAGAGQCDAQRFRRPWLHIGS